MSPQNLALWDLDESRAAQIRAQAHAIMARQRRRGRILRAAAGRFYDRAFEPALVAGIGCCSLAWAFLQAAALLA